MHVTAGGPYNSGFRPYYAAFYEERRQIRRTSNSVCFTLLIGVLLMGVILPKILLACLQANSYAFTGNNSFSNLQPVMYYLLIGVDYVLGLAIPAFTYFSARRIPLSTGLPFQKTGWKTTAVYVAFGSMICMLANYPANLVSEIQKHFGFSGTLPEMPLNNDPWVLALYIVNVAVIPPLVEELLFRGVALQSLRRFGDGFAVVVSAILFGVYHGNFIQMAFAFLCGLAMGYAVVRTNSLLPSILIHLINNALSVVLEILTRFYGQKTAAHVDNILCIVLVALGIAALLLLFWKKKLFTPRKRCSILPFSTRMGAAFGNFGAILFLFYGIASSVAMMYHG